MQPNYRLHTVIEYRELSESSCKEAYLDLRAARLEAQARLTAAEARKGIDRGVLEEEVKLRMLVRVLEENEARAHQMWIEKLRSLQMLQMLSLSADGSVEPALTREEHSQMAEWAAHRQAS